MKNRQDAGAPVFLFWVLCCCSAAPLLLICVWPQYWHLLFSLHLGPQCLLLYSFLRPNCEWYGRVITRFQTSRKEVWLTFDDGPSAEYTPQILELLRKHNAQAGFFCIGRNVEKWPELAKRIALEGHVIGNHSSTHPAASFWSVFGKAAEAEILATSKAIEAATGESPRLFRAPVGMANYFVHSAAQKFGMELVGWSHRGYDTWRKDAEQIVRSMTHDLRPGSIILLHEKGSIANKDRDGVCVLELLLARLKEQGYACVGPEERSEKREARSEEIKSGSRR